MSINSNNILKNNLSKDINDLLDDKKSPDEFKQEFSRSLHEYTNSLDIIFENNLIDSLRLSLKLLNVEENDYILMPAVGEKSLLTALEGRNIIFIPVHPKTLTIDVIALQKVLMSLDLTVGKANIIAIETAGLPADYLALEKIATKFDANIISIANTGPGASINSQNSNNFADIALINFDSNSSISIPDSQVAMIFNKEISTNKLISKLNSFNAIMLKHKLRLYDTTESKKAAEIINFLNMNLDSKIERMFIPAGFETNGNSYFLFLKERGDVSELKLFLADNLNISFIENIEYIADENSGAEEYYSGYFQSLEHNKHKLERIVTLRVNSYAKINEIKSSSELINEFYKSR